MSTFIGNDFLSEQAKIASLQEQIRDARNAARTASIAAIVSAVFAGVFSALSFDMGNWEVLPLVIIFAVAAFICLISEWSNNKTKNRLLMELDAMSVKIPTCPKCGKQIPQGNYPFCPSCGSALDRK